MAENRLTTRQWQAWDAFLRWCYFVCFAVVAMATIGLAVLAQPLARYFNDQAALRLHEKAIADLIELRDQQAQLLANSSHPAVVERVAIHHLKYQSAQSAFAEDLYLPASWPDLSRAVDRMEQASDTNTSDFPAQRLIQILAQQTHSQWILFVLGSVMVVVCLLSFSTPVKSPSQNNS